MIGAVERVRPKTMTAVSIMAGLLPILWATGAGSEVTRRIAVPVIGGMITSTLLTLIVIPAIYGLVKRIEPSGREPALEGTHQTISGVRHSASRTMGKPRPM